METRSIVIGLVAVVAAFAAAFGMAKSGGSKTDTAGAGVKAQTIKVVSPAAVTGVEVGGTLPALKAERKKAAKKKHHEHVEHLDALGERHRDPRPVDEQHAADHHQYHSHAADQPAAQPRRRRPPPVAVARRASSRPRAAARTASPPGTLSRAGRAPP